MTRLPWSHYMVVVNAGSPSKKASPHQHWQRLQKGFPNRRGMFKHGPSSGTGACQMPFGSTSMSLTLPLLRKGMIRLQIAQVTGTNFCACCASLSLLSPFNCKSSIILMGFCQAHWKGRKDSGLYAHGAGVPCQAAGHRAASFNRSCRWVWGMLCWICSANFRQTLVSDKQISKELLESLDPLNCCASFVFKVTQTWFGDIGPDALCRSW